MNKDKVTLTVSILYDRAFSDSAPGVVGTVSSPSVEVTSVGWLACANVLKHALLALWRFIGDMVLHC